jgi:glycosyltransferase involved in cell wall biosynthesis
MKIGINASFTRKPDSGMGQVSINFLKKLIELNPESRIPNPEFFLYLEEDVNLDLPKNFHKRIFLPPYKRDDLIRKVWWEKYLLPKKIKKDGCDVLFSLYQSSTITKEAPHIMLVHDCIWKIFPNYLNNARKKKYYELIDKGIKKADKIMTISESSKKDIQKFYKIEDKKIALNPIDCDAIFKQKVSKENLQKISKKYNLEKDNYLFYVGGFDVRKNVEGLINAFGILWQERSQKENLPDLAIAGGFNPDLVPLVTDLPKEIAKAANKYGVPKDKIKLLGFVEQGDLPALYQGAEAFCFPSLYEGFGLPILEAFNSGCPVIASRNSSLGEIINKKNSFVAKNGDDKDLAETIWRCLKKRDERERKIDKAFQTAQKFSWDKFLDNFFLAVKDWQ